MIIGNLIKIHHDKRYWSNPETFDPQRFIDKESGKCINNINLMPFSTGKRYCLGQTLAEKDLFLFFVGLMKAFDFTCDKNEPLPDCDYNSGSTVAGRKNRMLSKTTLQRAFFPQPNSTRIRISCHEA